MEMDLVMAMMFIMIAMVIGEIVSTKTKAFVPSVFVTALLFLLGYWTFFPKDIVNIAAFGQPFAGLSMYLLITHMGSLMNIKELLSQWKTVLISLAGVFGIIIILLTIGKVILGYQTVVVGAPPLTGGIVAAILMRDAAAEKGLEMLSVLAILVYVAQGFVGYPITALLLKKEGNRLLSNYSKDDTNIKKDEKVSEDSNKKPLIPKLPDKFNTTYMLLLKLSIVAFFASRFSMLINNALKSANLTFTIHPLVTCLIFGVLFAEIGFLDRQVLSKCQ